MSKAIDEWVKLFNSKENKSIIRYALTGDGSSADTADVDGRSGWAWVRYDEKDDRASQVMNYRYPGISQDVPVVIGKQYSTDRFYQILGLNLELYYQSMTPGSYTSYLLPIHGSTHAANGNDPVEISTGNIVHGKVIPTTPVSLNVYSNYLTYEHNGSIVAWPGGTITLSTYVPGTVGTHRYVLVSLNVDTNTLQATAGVLSPSPVAATVPDVPSGAISLAAVHLSYGDTTITVTDIYDYRILFSAVGDVARQINDRLAVVEANLDYLLSVHMAEG